MNIYSNGPSHEEDDNDFERKEKRVSETEERSNLVMDSTMMMMMMNNHDNNNNINNGVEFEFEIWPVEHPMEPPDEDRPVKCPIPHSSLINEQEKRIAVAEEKKFEEDDKEVGTGTVRPVRKRHHITLTAENDDLDHDYDDGNDGDDDDNDYRSNTEKTIMPLTRMSPLPPLPTQNLTIFQMLQQFDKFDH
ncbi:uncharacterized protein LOC115722935 [Cannabis sativa]|uniref:uncharacterized protein LOC115722935 n=1 Tax=Cannabis sativa TaxID=3483 RepID=UPI0029C9CE48|nr:uncharacterized protein LOC115722935 [Cannabis sativa]